MDQEITEIKNNMEDQVPSQPSSGSGQKKGFRQFFQLGEVGGYFFRKKDPSRPSDVNIRMMHGINKISIIVFLLGVIYIVLRRFL
jgi:hypothetical protein